MCNSSRGDVRSKCLQRAAFRLTIGSDTQNESGEPPWRWARPRDPRVVGYSSYHFEGKDHTERAFHRSGLLPILTRDNERPSEGSQGQIHLYLVRSIRYMVQCNFGDHGTRAKEAERPMLHNSEINRQQRMNGVLIRVSIWLDGGGAAGQSAPPQ